MKSNSWNIETSNWNIWLRSVRKEIGERVFGDKSGQYTATVEELLRNVTSGGDPKALAKKKERFKKFGEEFHRDFPS